MCWLVPWAKPGLAFFFLLNSSRKTTECRYFYTISYVVKVILCQKHSFLLQLIQNITTDFSLNYKFSTCWLHQIGFFCPCFDIQNNLMYTTCTELVVFLYWTRNSTKNILGKLMEEWVLLTKNNLYLTYCTLYSIVGTTSWKWNSDKLEWIELWLAI